MTEQVKWFDYKGHEVPADSSAAMFVKGITYHALRAEAEARRAENGRLKEQYDKLFKLSVFLRIDSTDARILLRDIAPFFAAPHGRCDLHRRIDTFLTATPAPEVLAEQGERQEAQVMGRVHHNPDHPEPVRAVLNSIGRTLPDNAPLYTTPQPSKDVRALVEAMNFACKSLCHVTSSDGSGHADIALSVLRMAGVDAEERERLVDGWKASCQWRIDKAHRQAQRKGGCHG